MLNNSCIEFINELASKAPVPGGGGASAYVGALGMSLGSMVGNLTLGKKKYAEVEEDIKKLLELSQEIIEGLKALVNKDAEVFFPLSQAYGMPKDTEEQQRLKEETLQRALVDATLVPLEIARYSLRAIKLHEEYARIGTRIAISDVGVGVVFCKAALLGAKLNVLINTKIMKDQELKNKIETELKQLVDEGVALSDKIYNEVEGMLV